MRSLDWGFASPFAQRNGLLDSRRHHWYPATFIPEIPYSLVEVLSLPGARVLEPFAGIGTTLFQAASLGRIPKGVEVCRVAVEVIRSLWMLLDPATRLPPLAALAADLVRQYRPSHDYLPSLASKGARIADLEQWFAPDTWKEICFLATTGEHNQQPGFVAAAWICLSATLKAVCAQDRGWGCVADNVRPRPEQRAVFRDARGRFVRNMTVLERDLSALRGDLSAAAAHVFSRVSSAAVVAHGDVLSVKGLRKESFDLIVSSPPYPQMTDYCLSQRLSYYLMGSTPEADLAQEIGARRRRFKSTSLDEYSVSMSRLATRAHTVLKSGGLACLVMPAFDISDNHAQRRAIVSTISDHFVTAGFGRELAVERILPSRRRHHNQKWTSLTRELIEVFRKP